MSCSITVTDANASHARFHDSRVSDLYGADAASRLTVLRREEQLGKARLVGVPAGRQRHPDVSCKQSARSGGRRNSRMSR